jgi:hypothetical protein
MNGYYSLWETTRQLTLAGLTLIDLNELRLETEKTLTSDLHSFNRAILERILIFKFEGLSHALTIRVGSLSRYINAGDFVAD